MAFSIRSLDDSLAPAGIQGLRCKITQLRRDGLSLRSEPREVRADPQLCMVAVSANGLALQFVASETKDRVVHAAVSNNGLALQFAPARCRCDKELVLAAVSRNGMALQFAALEMHQDTDVIAAAVRQNPKAMMLLPSGGEGEAVPDTGHAQSLELPNVLFVSEDALVRVEVALDTVSELPALRCVPQLEPYAPSPNGTGGRGSKESAPGRRRQRRGSRSEGGTAVEGAFVEAPFRTACDPIDPHARVIVRIPDGISEVDLLSFLGGRRACFSDFVLEQFFAEPAGQICAGRWGVSGRGAQRWGLPRPTVVGDSLLRHLVQFKGHASELL